MKKKYKPQDYLPFGKKFQDDIHRILLIAILATSIALLMFFFTQS